MTRLFLRLYAAMLVVLVGALLAFAFALRPPPPTLPVPPMLQPLLATPDTLTAPFADAVDPARRAAAEGALAGTLGLPVAVVPRARVDATLSPLQARRLARGEPVVDVFDTPVPALIVALPDQPFVVVVHADGGIGPASRGAVVMGVLLLLAAAGGVLTLRPLQLQLAQLTDAARRLGRGELNARADLPPDVAVGELGGAFDDMAARVADLVRGREELLAAVSHELRTPLARVRFATDLLADEPDARRRAARAEQLQADVDGLEEIVGELLRYATLADGERVTDTAAVDLADVARSAVAAAAGILGDKALSLTVEAAVVRGDARLLERAVRNVVSNAARYADGAVAVSVRREGGDAVVDVDDDGPGVPPADRRRVFEPLVRLDAARSRDAGGAGLGLALTARILAAHRGAVTVEDGPLGGARFRLRLPAASASEAGFTP